MKVNTKKKGLTTVYVLYTKKAVELISLQLSGTHNNDCSMIFYP